MLKLVLPVVGFCMVAVYGVQEYIKHSQTQQVNGSAAISQNNQVAQVPDQIATLQTQQKASPPVIGRKARVQMDARGHFITNARMNGRNVEVLVDTGATAVAINKKTARRLGIMLNPSDFKYLVTTANGQTKAANATIKRIQIGNVSVKNVRAAVLDDDALQSTLLGMTFLGQLRSFEVKNGELLLVQ